MEKRILVAFAALGFIASACNYGVQRTAAPEAPFYESPSSQYAAAGLVNAQGSPVGLAEFSEVRLGVLVTLKVVNLPPGKHGVHIHAVGKCDTPDFTSAGPHFNPNGKQHGLKNAGGPHAGDLPNLEVGREGKGTLSYVDPHVSLEPGASNSVLLGTAIVIHASPDDETTDPSGNSGARIACGAIQKKG